MQAPIQESCVSTLCENDAAPSPIQSEDTLPQEGVDHESRSPCVTVFRGKAKSHLELLMSVLG